MQESPLQLERQRREFTRPLRLGRRGRARTPLQAAAAGPSDGPITFSSGQHSRRKIGFMQKVHASRSASTVHSLYIHLVFVVKKRKSLISGEMLQFLRETFDEVCNDLECTLISCNSDDDHIHAFVAFPPKIAISLLVNRMKGISSRRIGQRTFASASEDRRLDGDAFWSPSYFVKTAGDRSADEITDYIRNQGRPKRARKASR